MREAAARALGCLGRDGLEAILEDGGLEHKDLEAGLLETPCNLQWSLNSLSSWMSRRDDFRLQVRGCAVLAVGWSGVAGRDCVDRPAGLLLRMQAVADLLCHLQAGKLAPG